jgi:Rps23 Pro-64 3,4-dihydroxylase Tpa1-like proline 4-hydroxylase
MKTNNFLSLSPDLNVGPWDQLFAEKGRVHIPNFLTDDAADTIFECLNNQKTWNLVCQQDGIHQDLNDDVAAIWNEAQLAKFTAKLHEQARTGFQYLYRTIPIYDIYHKRMLPGNFLNEIFLFLNSPAFLNFLRTVLQMPDITFADAQATCYTSGDFLTKHDDSAQGKNRLAGYVLNLTPSWNPNWGGALQFYDSEDNCVDTLYPSYNALNVFRVPQPHAVTFVPPFADGKRISITGWLRAGADPGC